MKMVLLAYTLTILTLFALLSVSWLRFISIKRKLLSVSDDGTQEQEK